MLTRRIKFARTSSSLCKKIYFGQYYHFSSVHYHVELVFICVDMLAFKLFMRYAINDKVSQMQFLPNCVKQHKQYLILYTQI